MNKTLVDICSTEVSLMHKCTLAIHDPTLRATCLKSFFDKTVSKENSMALAEHVLTRPEDVESVVNQTKNQL
jgi:hypothetical protein